MVHVATHKMFRVLDHLSNVTKVSLSRRGVVVFVVSVCGHGKGIFHLSCEQTRKISLGSAIFLFLIVVLNRQEYRGRKTMGTLSQRHWSDFHHANAIPVTLGHYLA